METSLHSGSAVECRGKSLHQAAVAQKNGQSRSRKAKKQTGHRHRWIVKPATDACGHGIHIFDGDQVGNAYVNFIQLLRLGANVVSSNAA